MVSGLFSAWPWGPDFGRFPSIGDGIDHSPFVHRAELCRLKRIGRPPAALLAASGPRGPLFCRQYREPANGPKQAPTWINTSGSSGARPELISRPEGRFPEQTPLFFGPPVRIQPQGKNNPTREVETDPRRF